MKRAGHRPAIHKKVPNPRTFPIQKICVAVFNRHFYVRYLGNYIFSKLSNIFSVLWGTAHWLLIQQASSYFWSTDPQGRLARSSHSATCTNRDSRLAGLDDVRVHECSWSFVQVSRDPAVVVAATNMCLSGRQQVETRLVVCICSGFLWSPSLNLPCADLPVEVP